MLRPWDDEAHAAAVVVALLGGRSNPRDPGGGAVAVHDFDVLLDDGTVIAVEVTRHNRQDHLALLAAIDRHNPHFPGLLHDWHLGMRQGTYDVKTVRAEAALHLADLEAEGIDRARLGQRPADDDHPSFSALRSLGVKLAYQLTEADPKGGLIDLGLAPSAGTTAPDVVVSATERNARRHGKAEKLAAAVADERHLFVWVETSRDDAVAAFAFGTLPERAPDLPDGIDAVWLATAFETPHVWRYSRVFGWEDFGAVAAEPPTTD